MKIKTEQEIVKIAEGYTAGRPQVISTCNGIEETVREEGFYDGYTQAQSDLLESASEGFDEYKNLIDSECNLHPEAVIAGKLIWQACSLHHAKLIKEKDERIKELEAKFEKMYQQGCSTQAELNSANENIFHLKNKESKYQEAVKDIEFLLLLIRPLASVDRDKVAAIRSKYGLDKQERES